MRLMIEFNLKTPLNLITQEVYEEKVRLPYVDEMNRDETLANLAVVFASKHAEEFEYKYENTEGGFLEFIEACLKESNYNDIAL